MASIRRLPNGKTQVCWRENVRDEYGAAISGKYTQRTETYADEKQAERRKLVIELEIESGHAPSTAKTAAEQPLGHYARKYFDALEGVIDDRTVLGYRDLYRVHIQPTFGSRPVASILPSDVESWVATLLNAKPFGREQSRSHKTVKQAFGVLRRILRKAVLDKAIASNPAVEVRVSPSSKRRAAEANFSHRPLSASQIAAVAEHIAERQRNSVFALAVTFSAFTGVRAAELAGLEVGDVMLSEHSGTAGAVKISRTKTRRKAKGQPAQWIIGTPKSAKSTRTVPLDAWLADDMRDYLQNVHQDSGNANAPLFPGRLNRHSASQQGRSFSDPVDMLDWGSPVVADFVYESNFKPALAALNLPQARWHDLRHSFAVMSLSAGEHYMNVSKMLGHQTFTLTLDTYGDYITKDEGGKSAPLARPVAEQPKTNVVPLDRRIQ